MMNNGALYLGIDLGTSGVKCVLLGRDGIVKSSQQKYEIAGIYGWSQAIRAAVIKLELGTGPLLGMAFSSQVGTYVVDQKDVVVWWESHGREELDWLMANIGEDALEDAVSMRHPRLVSYPLPRYLYIKKAFPRATKVVMPKDYFVERLTGRCVSDKFTYRGLFNFEKGRICTELLQRLGIDFSLPEIVQPTDVVGTVSDAAATEFGIPADTPVYCGMNDFFAGLVGMGVCRLGDAFDLSGTSEHVGFISDKRAKSDAISGDFVVGHATYGGTKSSGKACDLAISELDGRAVDGAPCVRKNAPVFLPYLMGERAPVYDENARGVMFGFSHTTSRDDMAYACLEGVAFSIKDVAQHIGMAKPKRMIVGGGAAKSPLLNALKAELFDTEIWVCTESANSALGAAMTAMVGAGEFDGFESAASLVRYDAVVRPMGQDRETLCARFATYKALYPALKEEFKIFNSQESKK